MMVQPIATTERNLRGGGIHKQLDNVYLHDATIKRSLRVRNIESLFNSIKISDKKFLVIKPTALFICLIAIAQRDNNIERFFSYELTMFLMPPFKDGLMQKSQKATLCDTLLSKKS